ncbi:3-sulfinopropanoyl-CoA desulfinase [Alisedimentitalea sp. MJ-SS2]|uniref:3-sulfinopropanoyl-CoA desulfinase n=1 Tax=Aliisedimentitalea sp. MJ-SS2 TaxID=3049795 RepID=UPI002907E584|nr:3-sulfinopropanoyl-CoA desulfinase [Alisedimentitalea sp. MJ-SS2]MDU8927238.1 3-sulfinopropanoyl-CoA desulfinase [Alisedimentitalea sp. MJ-SS2]
MFYLNDDHRALQEAARKLAQGVIRERAAEVDRSEDYPWHNVEALTQAGFMGMTIPKEYGGLGLSYMDAVLVIEEMAKVCGVTGRIVVEANMGAIGAVMKYGSHAQKKLAAGLVLAGDKPAICITEPGAGSAATEMTTTAEKVQGGYVLNGTKHWITGGGVSKFHLIFARVMDGGEFKGIGGFIAIRDETKGLKIGTREPAMGLRGIPETEVIFEDMEIGEDMVVIPPEGVERGFAGLMSAYNAQRIGAATVALGVAQGAYDLALDYAKTRQQFGRPIGEFQGLQWMLADMSIGLSAARGLIHNAAMNAGDGFPDMREAAQAKILASETAIKVTNDALQIHGSAGYSRNLPLERMARDARMFTIGGGTAQVLRTQVAGSILGMKVPQTRDGYAKLAERG